MNIAGLSLKNRVMLAPMAGISDLPYRRLMKSFGAGLVFTEMVSANGLVRTGRKTRELLASSPDERPLGIQLFGDDPETMSRAATLVRNDGDLLDLNLGCPVPKVVRTGAGSALLRDPQRVGEIVAAVRRVFNGPLTVKLRSGWDAGSVNFLEVARIAAAAGADAIILHPRTRAQGFGGRADWEHIRRLKDAVPVPVIGSGDIFSAADAVAMLEQTGCDGLMIGRGGYGNPWLIRDILARLAGGEAPSPTPSERRQVARRHIDLYLESFPESRAVREMRKHLAWYARGLPAAARFRTTVNGLQTLPEMVEALETFFASATEVV
jgi:nifR3 family TIM-barrel protein